MIKAQQRTRIEVLAVAVALVMGVAACGGSSRSANRGTPSTTSTSSAAAASPSTRSSTSAAKFHAVLTGQDHSPVATKRWHYTVRVTSADGRPMSGTVETEFAFGGQVVGRESPPSHRLKHGMLSDVVEFPSKAIGAPIELQVVVHTSAGTQTLDWPVSVKP